LLITLWPLSNDQTASHLKPSWPVTTQCFLTVISSSIIIVRDRGFRLQTKTIFTATDAFQTSETFPELSDLIASGVLAAAIDFRNRDVRIGDCTKRSDAYHPQEIGIFGFGPTPRLQTHRITVLGNPRKARHAST
jgi:hypothetical protein